MTSLREAATQALEALEAFMQDSPRPYDALQGQAAMDALKAALAEPENWELRRLHAELERCKQVCAATSEAWREEAALAEPVQQGCDHCNHPLYAAIKCRVCGRKTPIIEPEIKKDNKPVAWMMVNPTHPRLSKSLHWTPQTDWHATWKSVPLYAAPIERNFCPRCGKRTQDIHTCTPP